MKLFAFLRPKRCRECGRRLRSKGSKQKGIGPDCAKKSRLETIEPTPFPPAQLTLDEAVNRDTA